MGLTDFLFSRRSFSQRKGRFSKSRAARVRQFGVPADRGAAACTLAGQSGRVNADTGAGLERDQALRA